MTDRNNITAAGMLLAAQTAARRKLVLSTSEASCLAAAVAKPYQQGAIPERSIMSPFTKSVLKYGSTLVLSIVIICLVFPVIPGVQFTGGIAGALGILALEVAFNVLAFLAGIFTLVILSLANRSFPTRRILTAFETLGFYGTTAVSTVALVVIGAVSLTIAAFMLSSFSIAGLLPALAASAALLLAGAPSWLLGGFNKKTFDEQLEKLRSTMKEAQIAEAVEALPAGSVVIIPRDAGECCSSTKAETSNSEVGATSSDGNQNAGHATRVPQPLLVHGSVRLPKDFAVSGAQARIRLLDTTLAGAPSVVLVEEIVAVLDTGDPVQFELRGEVPPASGSYTVSAHIKANPDPTRGDKYDQIEPGDCLNTQSYPVVLNADAPAPVMVDVFRV